MKILLVDDERSLVEVLKRGLMGIGHEVVTANNGQEGWDTFIEAEESFDLIIMDIKMPIMTGLELLAHIRDEDFDIPVIIITGHGDLENSIQAIKLGAFDFILKPFKFTEMTSILARLESLRIPVQEFKEFLPSYDERLQITFPSRIKYSMNVVERIQTYFQPIFKLYKISRTQMGLCAMEAISNAIIHGNLDIPSTLKEESWDSFNELIKEREESPEYGSKKVHLLCHLSSNRMTIEIEDQGNGFDTSMLPDPTNPENIMLGSGRGLFMIRIYMDEVIWNEAGNRIVMVKHLQ